MKMVSFEHKNLVLMSILFFLLYSNKTFNKKKKVQFFVVIHYYNLTEDRVCWVWMSVVLDTDL